MAGDDSLVSDGGVGVIRTQRGDMLGRFLRRQWHGRGTVLRVDSEHAQCSHRNLPEIQDHCKRRKVSDNDVPADK